MALKSVGQYKGGWTNSFFWQKKEDTLRSNVVWLNKQQVIFKTKRSTLTLNSNLILF